MAQISQIVTIKKQYQCDQCDTIHDRESQAEECCQPEVVEVYVCPVCSNPHFREADAIECCEVDPLNLPAYRPSAEELERHGQLRLESVK